MYILYFEDILNIVIFVNFVSFFLCLYNYFDEDFFMVFYDVVLILLIKNGVEINMFDIFEGLVCVKENKFFDFIGCYGDI